MQSETVFVFGVFFYTFLQYYHYFCLCSVSVLSACSLHSSAGTDTAHGAFPVARDRPSGNVDLLCEDRNSR
jgi:hypothetical protein